MFKHSIADIISEKLSPSKRKLFDFNVKILGTKTQLLRITISSTDSWGQTTEQYDSTVINNAIVKHPWASNIQIFGSLNQSINNYETSAIDLWDVLPIVIFIPFSGDTEEKQVAVKKGDLFVECLRDEHGNKIPLILEITKIYGSFFVKNIVGKYLEAALYRGTPAQEVQNIINIYLQGL